MPFIDIKGRIYNGIILKEEIRLNENSITRCK